MTTRFEPVREQTRRRDVRGNTLTFPESDATHGLLMFFREYKYTPSNLRGFADQTAQENIKDSILLPLPSNITDNFDLRVERFDQGMFGDAISQGSSYAFAGGKAPTLESLIENIGAPNIDNVVRGVSAGLGGLTAFLASKGGTAASVAGAVIGGDLGTGTVASSISAGAGALANPKAALQFKGVEMKRHTFDWTLVPRSQSESNTLETIIRTIKKNVLPAYANLGPLQRALLKYPSFVDCFFVGLDPVHYFRFKTSMVQTFNVDYTSNGNAILREGRPAAVRITMSMIESEIHTSGDYGGEG